MQKKGKKGKGRGKTGKGKSSVEPIDNKRADNNAEEEDEKGESEDEGHELDQMHVSDLQDSDNEQKHEVIDSNNAAEAVNASSECQEMLSNDTQAQHEKGSSQMSQGVDEDLNKLDSLGGNYGSNEVRLLIYERKLFTFLVGIGPCKGNDPHEANEGI